MRLIHINRHQTISILINMTLQLPVLTVKLLHLFYWNLLNMELIPFLVPLAQHLQYTLAWSLILLPLFCCNNPKSKQNITMDYSNIIQTRMKRIVS